MSRAAPMPYNPADDDNSADCPQCGAAPGAAWTDADMVRTRSEAASRCTQAMAEAWRWAGAGKALAATLDTMSGDTTARVAVECGCLAVAYIPKFGLKYAWRDASACQGGHASAGVKP